MSSPVEEPPATRRWREVLESVLYAESSRARFQADAAALDPAADVVTPIG